MINNHFFLFVLSLLCTMVADGVPTPSPTYFPKTVYFQAFQEIKNITLSQAFKTGVAQVIRNSIFDSLICCEPYVIRIADITDVTPKITSLRNLELGATKPTPVVKYEFTVDFLYSEFNFTSAIQAYDFITQDLQLTVTAGGFAKNLKLESEKSSCYKESSILSSSCAFLRYAEAGKMNLGLSYSPVFTGTPTFQPTFEATENYSAGISYAITVIIVMSLALITLCYFSYIYNGDMDDIKETFQKYFIDCTWAREEQEEEIDDASHFDHEMQEKVKTTADLGDPECRFGRGHKMNRTMAQRVVDLKPDWTAAPANIKSSQKALVRRYSTKPTIPVGLLLGIEVEDLTGEYDSGNTNGCANANGSSSSIAGVPEKDSEEVKTLVGSTTKEALAKVNMTSLAALWGSIKEEDDSDEDEDNIFNNVDEEAAKSKAQMSPQSPQRRTSVAITGSGSGTISVGATLQVANPLTAGRRKPARASILLANGSPPPTTTFSPLIKKSETDN
jgi:hypothetical protein